MREIRFKGKELGRENWVYGQYYFTALDFNDEFLHILRDVSDDCEFLDYFVNPATIRMWTGRKDKDGVDIYNGDTVEWTHILDHEIAVEGIHKCRILWNFKGVVSSSPLTGLWIRKVTRTATLLENDFNEEYFQNNYARAMETRENYSIKAKRYMDFEVIEND